MGKNILTAAFYTMKWLTYNRTLRTAWKLSTRKLNKEKNVNGQQDYHLYGLLNVITIHKYATALQQLLGNWVLKVVARAVKELADDSSNWWWSAEMCVCCVCLAKHIHLLHEHFLENLQRDTSLMQSFKSKASLKLIQLDGKALTGYWCKYFCLW